MLKKSLFDKKKRKNYRTTKSENIRTLGEKEKLQVFRNIWSLPRQTTREEKKIKKVPQTNEKTLRNNVLQEKYHQKDK